MMNNKAQGTIAPSKRASIAQGTIEYLVIVAVVIIIALLVTTLVINQGDNAQRINTSTNKVTNLVGQGGISIIDSVTSSNGEAIISLKNVSGKNLKISSITPVDEEGEEGTESACKKSFLLNDDVTCFLDNVDDICPCEENETVTCKYKINFEDGTDPKTITITNTCTSEISYYTINYLEGTGGTISGNIIQKVLPGDSGATVTAIPDEDYDFNAWSDGSTNPTRRETNVDESKTITATFIREEEPIVEFVPDCFDDGLDPIPICNCIDLNKARLDLTANYELQNDINMNVSQCLEFQSGEGFEPIGGCGVNNACWDEGYENYAFKGYFDGQDYTIYNLMINKPEQNYVGLFGMSTSDLNNIHLEDVDITGNESVGGLSAESFGLIYNSSSNGIITGNNYVGGLTGYAGNYNATISLSNSTATVNGNDYIGGLAGGSDSRITNCSFNGEITGNDYVGGLVGEHIEFSISNSHSSGEINGNDYVGGLVGSSQNGAEVLTNSYSSANINGNNYVGGLIGEQIYGNTEYSNSSGTITGNNYIGGLIGRTAESALTYSFSSSNVTGNITVGGLIGIQDGTINQVYSTGNVTGIEQIGGLVGRQNGEITQAYSISNVQGNYTIGGLVGLQSNSINESWATGTVTLEDNGYEEGIYSAGGLVGNQRAEINNSYAIGDIIGVGDSTNAMGGLVGSMSNNITNSYSIGNVSGNGEYNAPFVGMCEDGYLPENSYYQANSEYPYACGTWKTEAQLKQQITFEDWDFDTIWGINSETNDGYPYLQWQVE